MLIKDYFLIHYLIWSEHQLQADSASRVAELILENQKITIKFVCVNFGLPYIDEVI